MSLSSTEISCFACALPAARTGQARISMKESRFPAPACGGRRLRSTAHHKRTTPLVPLASLDLPNRGRRVAYGSMDISG